MIANDNLRRYSSARIQRDADSSLASDHVIVGDDKPAESVDEESSTVLETCLDAYHSAFDPVIHNDFGGHFAHGRLGSHLQRIDDGVDIGQFDFEYLAALQSE